MKNDFAPLQNIRMTETEKRHTYDAILRRAHEAPVISPFVSRTLFLSLRRYGALAFGLLLVLGTGIVRGAESSLPGDSLYGVKTGVNERVLSAFAFSEETKARVETYLVHRRLQEIELVLLEDKEDDEADPIESSTSDAATKHVIAYLTERAQDHTESAQDHIEAVHDEGATDTALLLATELETAIDIHASALATIGNDETTDDEPSADATVLVLGDAKDTLAALGGELKSEITISETTITPAKAESHVKEAEDAFLTLLREHGETIDTPAPEEEAVMTEENNTMSQETTITEGEEASSSPAGEALSIVTAPFTDTDETTAVSEVGDTTVLEEDPSLPSPVSDEAHPVKTRVEVRALVANCRDLYDAGEYNASFIACTDALTAISAIRLAEEINERSEGQIDVSPEEEAEVSIHEEEEESSSLSAEVDQAISHMEDADAGVSQDATTQTSSSRPLLKHSFPF